VFYFTKRNITKRYFLKHGFIDSKVTTIGQFKLSFSVPTRLQSNDDKIINSPTFCQLVVVVDFDLTSLPSLLLLLLAS